jgi:peptidoglycan hydrolase CwlO-like protein
MKLSPFFFIVVLFCISFSLFSPAVYSQDFSSVDRDLSELESLISDTLKNSEEQQRQLDALRKNLAESGELIGNYESIIAERENLLKDLQARLNAMSETYRNTR